MPNPFAVARMTLKGEPKLTTDMSIRNHHERRESKSMKNRKDHALTPPRAGWVLPLATAGWLAATTPPAQTDNPTNAWAGGQPRMMPGMTGGAGNM
jgi:hypothetical protein